MTHDWELPPWLDTLVTFLFLVGATAICVVGFHVLIDIARAYGL